MPTSQNEEHFWPQRTSSEGVVQTGYEECIFLSTSQSIVQEIPVFLHGGESLYEFLCQCFGLGPAPRIFFKFLKIRVSVMRRLTCYVFDGRNFGGNFNCNLLFGTSKEHSELGKVHFETCSRNKIS